jgi:hypothetical protein
VTTGPSDWEHGVLDASRWLARQGKDTPHEDHNVGLSVRMLRALGRDFEGTEVRVVKQIAAWVRDMAKLRSNTPQPDPDILHIADCIEAGDWRQK